MITPLFDRVLLKPTEHKSSSIIVTNDTADNIAVVEAAGTDVKVVKIGDKVVFNKYATAVVKLDNNEYLLIKEIDILATI